jgi:hypothetical protein
LPEVLWRAFNRGRKDRDEKDRIYWFGCFGVFDPVKLYHHSYGGAGCSSKCKIYVCQHLGCFYGQCRHQYGTDHPLLIHFIFKMDHVEKAAMGADEDISFLLAGTVFCAADHSTGLRIFNQNDGSGSDRPVGDSRVDFLEGFHILSDKMDYPFWGRFTFCCVCRDLPDIQEEKAIETRLKIEATREPAKRVKSPA